MKDRQADSTRSPTKGFQLGWQSSDAWKAILGFLLLSVLGALAGAGKILNLAFPVGAFAVAVFLYRRYPILYVGFTWWMWFLTPFIRRLADYRSSFSNPSPILLAPYLVILVTLATLWQHLPKTHRQGGLPFILTFLGVLYGYLVGLIQASPVTVTIAFLDWLTPVLFGFHLFVNWQYYPGYSQTIQRTFVWGVLITGVYGIFQYLVAPDWDRFWLINTEMVSAGKPEPLAIRVWSTMSGPGVFAIFMMAGLLLLFTNKGTLRLPASGAGYIAFLLSLVRSAWVGWVMGFLTLATSLKSNLQIRLIVSVLVMALLVIPLTKVEPFAQAINSRFGSLSNTEEDRSAVVRRELVEKNIDKALVNFQGNGIGTAAEFSDNAFLTIIFSLGWFGTILYMGGMLLLVFELFQGSEMSFDPFAGAARAITIGVFVQLAFGSVMIEGPGMVLWGFLSINLAAKKYYSQTKN